MVWSVWRFTARYALYTTSGTRTEANADSRISSDGLRWTKVYISTRALDLSSDFLGNLETNTIGRE